MEEKKPSSEALSQKLHCVPGLLAAPQSPLPQSIASGPRGTLPHGKKNRHGTSRQINVRLGQSLWNSQDPSPAGLFRPPLNRRADTVPTAQPPGPSTEGVLRLFSGCFALAMLWHRPRGILVPPNVSPHRQPENDKADWALRMTL